MKAIEIRKIKKSDIRNAVLDLQEKKFKSKFHFLACTNGLRPASLSILLGTAGSGKSTLAKSIISDIAEAHEVDLWLSEETADEYTIDMQKVRSETKIENINFIEEKLFRDKLLNVTDYNEIKGIFLEIVKRTMNGILIIDNATTSAFFDGRKPHEQAKMVYALADIAKNENVAILVVMHTSKGINSSLNRLIVAEDSQGSSSVSKAAQFFYILQSLTVNGTKRNFIQIAKHRNFELEKSFYMLSYKNGAYVGDVPVNFAEIKTLWKQRDSL